jgi:hypothetical protein
MPDALGKAMRWRDRAAECGRLAEMMGSVEGEIGLSNCYRRIAEHCIALAEGEETCARQHAAPEGQHHPNRLGAGEKEVAN